MPNLLTASEIVEKGYIYMGIGQSNWIANVTQSGSQGAYSVIDTSSWIVENKSDASHVYLTKRSPYDSTSISYTIENCTETNIPNYFAGGLVPRIYHVWLQYNNTVWIEEPISLLASTNNPPQIPSLRSGFLGTGLPTGYVITAVSLVLVTLAAGTIFFVLHKKAIVPP
jgi:hypothetical protein